MALNNGTCLIEKNIIALNPVGDGIRCSDRVEATIRDNLVWMNEDENGAGACEDWWMGDGNVVADPLFCDPSFGRDFRVMEGSPALEMQAGAFLTPGCDEVPVRVSTWGGLKSRFRDP